MGYGVDNYYFEPHYDGMTYERFARHHRGDATPPIDVKSLGSASAEQWAAIVTQAWNGGDTALTNALATPWPTWTADHVTAPGKLDVVRVFIRLEAPQI